MRQSLSIHCSDRFSHHGVKTQHVECLHKYTTFVCPCSCHAGPDFTYCARCEMTKVNCECDDEASTDERPRREEPAPYSQNEWGSSWIVVKKYDCCKDATRIHVTGCHKCEWHCTCDLDSSSDKASSVYTCRGCGGEYTEGHHSGLCDGCQTERICPSCEEENPACCDEVCEDCCEEHNECEHPTSLLNITEIRGEFDNDGEVMTSGYIRCGNCHELREFSWQGNGVYFENLE